MTTLLKNHYIVLFVLFIVFLGSCSPKNDYSCTMLVETVITNPDNSQSTVTSTDTKPCSDCTDKDVQKLKDQGYSCK